MLTTKKQIRNLKDHIEMLETRYAYLRESFELEVEKQLDDYKESAHVNLKAEIDYWKKRSELLQRTINHMTQEVPGDE